MFKIKRKPKRRREHAYRVRLEQLIRFGMLPSTPGLHQLDIRHDDDCRLLRGGYCNCDAEFVFQAESDYKPETTVN
jgi:hypothetical protein